MKEHFLQLIMELTSIYDFTKKKAAVIFYIFISHHIWCDHGSSGFRKLAEETNRYFNHILISFTVKL